VPILAIEPNVKTPASRSSSIVGKNPPASSASTSWRSARTLSRNAARRAKPPFGV
jgi:hypothetical protein